MKGSTNAQRQLDRERRIRAAKDEQRRESKKFARGKGQFVAAAQRAVSLGFIRDENTFSTAPEKLALVQCWWCGRDEHRSYGIGRPSEIRCRACNGPVEALTVDGKPV